MKKKYCFLIDTSADKSILQSKENIEIMPFEIIVNDGKSDKIFCDWKNIDNDTVFEYLAKNYDVKTSQPAVGYIEAKLEELLQEYEKIICIPITKHFSGTYNSVCMVKKDLEKKYGKNRILVLDTRGVSVLQNRYVEEISKLLKQGLDLNEIEKTMKHFYEKFISFVCVTNASQLVKGGRLTGLKALLVKTLNLKLLIRYLDGKLEFQDKSTNLTAAIDKGVQMVHKQLNLDTKKIVNLSIFSNLNEKESDKYVNYIKDKYKDSFKGKIYIGHFPTAIITHLGNNTIAIFVESE